MNTPRYSVVIPTHQRRELVLESVRALARQEPGATMEVVVVVDGSVDGTAEALRSWPAPYPFRVLEQRRGGAAAARNAGAAIARGEVFLFLDDDMEAHPRLLLEHERSHLGGAEVVIGHVPLHPESPVTIMTRGVKLWAENRAKRLSAEGATVALNDVLSGQLSVRRDVFHRLRGFDTAFTRGGAYGNEDYDFGVRLLAEGVRCVFNPQAISWQKYVVTPQQFLSQWRHVGAADVAFSRKHPEECPWIFRSRGSLWRHRRIARLVLGVPYLALAVRSVLRKFVAARIEGGAQDPLTSKLFRLVLLVEYWRGVREAGDVPARRPVRVLAYHAIADFTGAPFFESYGVPPTVFVRQLETLQKAGYQFIHPEEFVRYLEARAGVVRRALLLTFDDGSRDLLDAALPVLKRCAVPAVAFAVSARLGFSNDWAVRTGAPEVPLLDADGLRTLTRGGVEIGSHSRTHPDLTTLSPEELSQEIAGSLADLQALGLGRPRLFAFPYGSFDVRVQGAVRDAGLQAAFTVEARCVRPGQDPFRIPRIEVLPWDVGWLLRWKVADAGGLVSRLVRLSLWKRLARLLPAALRRWTRSQFRRSVRWLLDW